MRLSLLLLLLVSSCWQEQHHDIIPPPQPNYLVWGKVFSSGDGTPVSGAAVLLGDDVMGTTDSTGMYVLPHVLGSQKPYEITVSKPHFETYTGSVTVGYGIDTVQVEDIRLGKIYYHLSMFNPGAWRSFSPQGLVWRGAHLWSADSMSGIIFAHNYDSYMSVAEKHILPHYPLPKGEFYIAPLGLEWHQNYLITYDDQKNRFYELILTSGDTALIKTSYTLPPEITSAGNLWDLTWDGRRLWSCSAGAYRHFYSISKSQEDDVIYRHSGDLSVAATFRTVEIDDGIVNPTGIAWDPESDMFWLNSRGNHRLYMLDENLQVLGYYVLDESITSLAPYQICWGNGYLWGCVRDSEPAIHSVGGPTQYIYKFGRLYP